jgi:hypothetical protein
MMGAMELLNIILGVVLRIVLPLGITLAVALILKRLDDSWREQSLHEAMGASGASGPLQSLQCWEAFGCRPEQRSNCKAYSNPEKPCWESMSSRGQLQEACQRCPFRAQKLATAAAGA